MDALKEDSPNTSLYELESKVLKRGLYSGLYRGLLWGLLRVF